MLMIKILLTALVWEWGAVASALAHATSVVQPFDTTSRWRGSNDKFVLGINTTKTQQHEDKHLSTISAPPKTPPLPTNSDTGNGERRIKSLLADGKDNSDKIHNDVPYEINKNNQQHLNLHNRLTSAMVDGGSKTADSSSSPSSSSASASSSSTSPSMSSYFERVERQESRTPAENKDKLLLHRHKRYLLFPEGSSFQLVFDLIVPIVDYTNFAIMGITCAVAWELPSKPPSEIIENFRHKLNDGTLGLSRRNDSTQQHLEYITTPTNSNSKAGGYNRVQPQNQLSFNEAALASGFSQQPRPLNAYYNTASQKSKNTNKAKTIPTYAFNPQPEESGQNAAAATAHWLPQSSPSASWQTNDDNKWWVHNKDRIQTQWQGNQWKWQPYPNTQRNGRNRKLLTKQPKHRIYPVFGKRKRRSIHQRHTPQDDDDELTQQLNAIHVKQHLDARHTLYSKIEKLYKTRGQNGTACVLRTLCETQKLQRKHKRNQHPDTFVMELIRAIFSLPFDELAKKSMDTPYVDAAMRAHAIEDCGQHYEGCGVPIWQAGVKL